MEQTKRGKVVVTGSFITDIAVFTSRFPADGETVPGRSIQFGPGGKGSNQATAASRAGAEVIMITKSVRILWVKSHAHITKTKI